MADLSGVKGKLGDIARVAEETVVRLTLLDAYLAHCSLFYIALEQTTAIRAEQKEIQEYIAMIQTEMAEMAGEVGGDA